MSKVCSITGSKSTRGSIIHRRGMAKKKGGVGRHVTKNVPRDFPPEPARAPHLGAGAEEVRPHSRDRARNEDDQQERRFRCAEKSWRDLSCSSSPQSRSCSSACRLPVSVRLATVAATLSLRMPSAFFRLVRRFSPAANRASHR